MNETEVLFSHILKCSRHELYQDRDRAITAQEAGAISSALKRRFTKEPIQYILGSECFYGLEFNLTQETFIPRPETELLVEEAIGQYRQFANPTGRKIKILEIGTGSGCIAVTLASLIPEAGIYATDISAQAIEIARGNAYLNKVGHRINFIQADLFPADRFLAHVQLDLILSNPPYIPSAEIPKLPPEVQFEPRLALDGGRDGLDFYRRIINHSPAYLREGGLLVFEIGSGQLGAVEAIFKQKGYFDIEQVVKDYNGIDRIIVARKADRYG